MNNIKCPQCGLVNWETAEWCAKCRFLLKDKSINPPTASFNSNNSNAETGGANFGSQSRNSQTGASRPAYSASAAAVSEDGFVIKNIERCNRNMMITCVLLIAGVLGSAMIFNRYLANVLLGPAEIAQDDLVFKNNVADNYRNYVKVNADEVFDTGGTYSEVSKYNVKTLKSKYFVLAVKDKLLLSEVEPDSATIDGAKNASVTGELMRMPSDVDAKILQPMLLEQPELRSDVLPLLLRAKNDFYYPAYIGGLVGFFVLLGAAYCLWNVLKRIGDPDNSSIMKSLAERGAPREIAASIDAEAAAPHEKIGAIHLMPNWIIKNNTFSMDLRHVEDIVWMYKKVTKHSVNFIPTGKTYEVVLHDVKGATISLNGRSLNDAKTDLILENVYRRAPWIVAGYDADLIRYWSSDKKSFIESVRQRRDSYFAGLNNTANPQPEPQ